MEILFAIFPVTWIIFNLPFPSPADGWSMFKLVTGIVAIILIIFLLFGAPHYLR